MCYIASLKNQWQDYWEWMVVKQWMGTVVGNGQNTESLATRAPVFSRSWKYTGIWNIIFYAMHLSIMSRFLLQIEKHRKTNCSNLNCYQADRKGNWWLTIFWEAPEGSWGFLRVPAWHPSWSLHLRHGRFYMSHMQCIGLIHKLCMYKN